METYLVFLRNLKTGEDFVAPATARSHDEALLTVGEKHPARFYEVQTVYTLGQLERIITDIKRWPGVASRVQPLVEQMRTGTVGRRVGGALPPLPGQGPAPAKVAEDTQARTVSSAPAQGLSAIEALRALRGEAPQQALQARMDVIEEETLMEETEELQAPATAKPAMRTVSASIISRKGVTAQPSVLEVLKNLRG